MTQKSLTFDECKQLSSRIIAMNPNRRANMGQISSHLLDYYTELTKQPWLAQLVGQIRDLTAQQNQMMQEEMKAGETYQQLDRKITDLKKQLPFRSPHYFHFLDSSFMSFMSAASIPRRPSRPEIHRPRGFHLPDNRRH